MSRFYDALREASRSGQPLTGNASEPEWNAVELDGIELPPLPEISPVIDEPVAAAAPALDEPWASPVVEEFSSFTEAPQRGPLGTEMHVALDQKARLIPNVVNPVVVEHYRRLRTKILQARKTQEFRTLVITSASPQEGKTVTTLNLALSFALLPEYKVVVVDGDMRRGSLGKWLSVKDRPGLRNLIEGSATLQDVVFKSDEIPIHFVVAGNSKKAPAELLQSPHLGSHFRRISEQFTLAIIDSPPVNLLTDAQLIASKCDAVLMVARAFSTTKKAFELAARELAPFRVIGTVLNGGTRAQLSSRYNGYY